MAEKEKLDKRNQKNSKKSVATVITGFVKAFKTFLTNLKSELKRVIWPDRKKLVRSTATVLAICVIAGIILFLVDSFVGGLLEYVGFYSPNATTPQTTIETTVETTEAADIIDEETDEAADDE